MIKKKGIIYDQKRFFDLNAKTTKIIDKNIFHYYTIRSLINGYDWIGDSKTVLDYGCGTGETIKMFVERTGSKAKFYGADISSQCIKLDKKLFVNTNYEFFTVSDNKLFLNKKVDAAIIVNVLHHSKNHKKIFKTIYDNLKRNGKLVICDLSSNNPFVKLGRTLFTKLPINIKNRFSDDLSVDGQIPEKYVVNLEDTIRILKICGFRIVKIEHSHLFAFLFAWVDKIFPFSKNIYVEFVYKKIIKFEEWLLKYRAMQNKSEMFLIQCEKK